MNQIETLFWMGVCSRQKQCCWLMWYKGFPSSLSDSFLVISYIFKITTEPYRFSRHFITCKPFHLTLLAFSQFYVLFFPNDCKKKKCKCIHIYSYALGLKIWYRCAHPWDDYLTQSQHSLPAYSSLCRVNVLGHASCFCSSSSHFLTLILVSLHECSFWHF